MLRIKNIRVLKIIISVMFTSLFWGCSKTAMLDDEDQIITNLIINSEEFKTIRIAINDIKLASKSNSTLLNKNVTKNIDLSNRLTITEKELEDILTQKNYYNAKFLSKKTFEMHLAFSKLFNKYSRLKILKKEKLESIFRNVFDNEKKYNLEVLKSFDVCSENYANGIEDCSDSLGWNMLAAGFGGFLAGGGIASAGTISILGGLAYMEYDHCRQKVVSRWKGCRGI
ncbi:hypothetical protein [Sediminibacterium sp.]|uniref:hypothetical protein n=1 Tax=Sediminibacterium sp. TaxID=1917865 RepID=UPI0025FDB81C|nr:hypothetical protein [Sediminibacterium sp.]MBT9485599.1 hypothetical protein [Sediminibacterium sp.]